MEYCAVSSHQCSKSFKNQWISVVHLCKLIKISYYLTHFLFSSLTFFNSFEICLACLCWSELSWMQSVRILTKNAKLIALHRRIQLNGNSVPKTAAAACRSCHCGSEGDLWGLCFEFMTTHSKNAPDVVYTDIRNLNLDCLLSWL